MTTSTMIPLDKLTISPANVRKTGLKDGIAALAASIDAHGLLNNLVVIPADGDLFEVVAGGRRLAALKTLAKGKKVAADMPVPCNVLPPGASATEISLVENELRSAMHPADQYEAFRKLADEGQGENTIAARFGVTPAVVRQRMKLAVVSPKLMAIFRKGDMALEQMMAFTLTDDHKVQERVWKELPQWARENGDDQPIREALTKQQTASDSKLAKFVGLDVYRAAGGHVNIDLFDADGAGWLTNTDLLNRIVGEKLAEAAERVKAEGWKWVRHAPEFRWEDTQKDRHVTPTYAIPAEQEARQAALQAEMDAIFAEHGEEPTDPDAYRRLEELQEEIDALPEGAEVFTDIQKSISGAYVSVGYDGKLSIKRGVVRPEDKAALKALDGAGEATGEDEAEAPAKPKGGVPAALLTELTAHKTVAAQLMLAQDPATALVAVTHALALRMLYPTRPLDHASLQISGHSPSYSMAVRESVDKSAAGKKLAAIVKGWMKKLPKDPADLWGWLLKQKPETVQGLLAVCAGLIVDMVQANGAAAKACAGELCKAIRLDMADHWTPTPENYLTRASKKHLLAELEGVIRPEAVKQIESMKRQQAAETLEKELKGKRWLPEALRS